jgi:YfiH family protein
MTLPPPDPAFHWSAEPWGHALRCRPLAAIAQHAFTSKQLQLRPTTGADRSSAGSNDAYLLAWTQAAASVGAGVEQLRRVKQVHGNCVRVLKDGETGPDDAEQRPEADAMVANAAGVVLTVQVADCVPLLMADMRSGAVAAVHAGWRGTAANVAAAAVTAMSKAFDSRPFDLVAAIGPSIGPCCYEVGASVRDAFSAAGASTDQVARWFREGDGRPGLDLWAANRDQLEQAGLAPERIHVCGLCTKTHRAMFESYRVDGEQAGRIAALISVP